MRHGLMVGMDDQLKVLEKMISELADGPAMSVITGEPGAGKSTLWQHGCDHARGRGHRVLSCRPTVVGRELPFMGLIDMFDDGGVAVDDLPPPQQQALEAALMCTVPDHGELPSPAAVGVAVVTVVRRLATTTPVVIAVDEVAGLDRASAAVLGYLVRRLRGEPVGLLLSTVGAGGAGWPVVLDVDESFDHIRREHIHVGPLSAVQLRHLVEHRTGLVLARPTLVRLYRACGGNPATALHVANAMLNCTTPLTGRPLPVGPKWISTVQALMSALPEVSRTALVMAAALDHPTTHLLRIALEVSGPPTPGLAEAERAGLINVDEGAVRFIHPTYASAIYSAAGGEVRRSVHMRLSAVVTDPLEQARHLALATDDPDTGVSDVVERAAQEAERRGASVEAAELWTLASQHTPLDDPRHGRRLVSAALCLFWAGDCAHSRAALEEALEAATTDLERAYVLLSLALVTFYDSGARQAVHLLHQAQSMMGNDFLLAAELNLRVGWFAEYDLELRTASVRAARDCLRHIDPVDDRLAGSVAIAASYLDFLAGHRYDPVRLREAADALPVAGLSWEIELGHTVVGLVEANTDLRQVQTGWRARLCRARQLGHDAAVPSVLHHLVLAEFWLGDWDMAKRYADELVEAVEQTGQRLMRPKALYLQALLAAHRGDVAAAACATDDGYALSEQDDAPVAMASHLAVRGFLQLSTGDFAAADACLSQAAGLVEATGIREPTLLRFVGDQIEAAVAVGAVSRADELLADLGNRTSRPDDSWVRVVQARGRAQVLMARGELAGAAAAIDEANLAHSSLHMPFERARTHLVHGQVLRRLRRRRLADQALHQAEALFSDLGAALWAAQAAAERLRLGYHRSGLGELTPTEAQVAKLIADQYSNNEIAAALVISRRTVENHLTRIYRKLSVNGRAELCIAIAAGIAHLS